jgi:hypothetical protein
VNEGGSKRARGRGGRTDNPGRTSSVCLLLHHRGLLSAEWPPPVVVVARRPKSKSHALPACGWMSISSIYRDVGWCGVGSWNEEEVIHGQRESHPVDQ